MVMPPGRQGRVDRPGGMPHLAGGMPDLAGGVGEAGSADNRGARALAQGPECGVSGAPGAGYEVARFDDERGGVLGCLAGDFGQD
jgi:hypothetical protein